MTLPNDTANTLLSELLNLGKQMRENQNRYFRASPNTVEKQKCLTESRESEKAFDKKIKEIQGVFDAQKSPTLF